MILSDRPVEQSIAATLLAYEHCLASERLGTSGPNLTLEEVEQLDVKGDHLARIFHTPIRK